MRCKCILTASALFDDDDDEEVDQQEWRQGSPLIDLIYRLLDPNPKSRMRIDQGFMITRNSHWHVTHNNSHTPKHRYFHKDMLAEKLHSRQDMKEMLGKEYDVNKRRKRKCFVVNISIECLRYRECDRHVQSRNHGTYCRSVETLSPRGSLDCDTWQYQCRDETSKDVEYVWSYRRTWENDFFIGRRGDGVVAVFEGVFMFLSFSTTHHHHHQTDTKEISSREQFEIRFETF